jgi:hypothetical protein
LLRLNTGRHQVGLLPVEVLLLVAGGARTLDELERLTGAVNGQVSRAVRVWLPHHSRTKGRVIQPQLSLLVRTNRPKPLRGHSYRLSEAGQALLKEAQAPLTSGSDADAA